MIISSPHVRGHTYFYLLLLGLGTLLRNSLALVRDVENAQVQLRLVMDVPKESSLPVSIYTLRSRLCFEPSIERAIHHTSMS